VKFIISSLDENEYRVDSKSFIEQLRAQWPKAEVREIKDAVDPYLFEWILPIGHRIDGALHRSLTTISLEGSLEDCAIFAVWYRTFVPPTYGLLFFDQGYHGHVNLHNETTEQQIIDAFMAENSSSE
jgi:hypothetical protein